MKLGVIVPNKNRKNTVDFLINYLYRYISKYTDKFIILSSESISESVFNISKSINVGAKILIDEKCDYLIVNAADIIPIKNVNYLWEGKNLTWFLNAGGLKININDFLKVNGFNENFYGWGYEDSEFLNRLLTFNIYHEKWTPILKTEIVNLDFHDDWNSKKASLQYWGKENPRFLNRLEYFETQKLQIPDKNNWYSTENKERNQKLCDFILNLKEKIKKDYYLNNGLKQNTSPILKLTKNKNLFRVEYQ